MYHPVKEIPVQHEKSPVFREHLPELAGKMINPGGSGSDKQDSASWKKPAIKGKIKSIDPGSVSSNICPDH